MKKYFSFGLALMAALLMPFNAMAICSGSSNTVDAYYSNANDVANKSPEKGWNWQVETTSAGVVITVQFLDEYVGMAAPQLFLFDDNGVLIGNPIAMSGWAESTRTATHTLTGYKTDDKVVFLVQIAYAGHVMFTERIKYIVGSQCSAEELPTVIGSCEGSSKAVDSYYTEADKAAANPFEKGYNWSVTTTDKAVEIEVEFLDNIPGLAAPYIFFFKDGVLDGGDKAMEMFGQKALYTLSGAKTGDVINFLVKIAYVEHVAFTERITYTVGDDCSTETKVEEFAAPEHATKLIENGKLYIIHNGVKYDALGRKQ